MNALSITDNLKDLAGIHLLKVNNRNSKTMCEISSKLTIRTSVLTYFTPVFLLLTLNM